MSVCSGRPGWIASSSSASDCATLVASTENWQTLSALGFDAALEVEAARRARLVAQSSPAATTGFGAELTLAADQFIIAPATRAEDTVVAKAEGDEARTVIAGYHWFTDWGRDTMISLEGLTLWTGRQREAAILRTFGHYVRDGLIPNMFPEGEARASTTPPTRRSGSSTRSIATSPRARTRRR